MSRISYSSEGAAQPLGFRHEDHKKRPAKTASIIFLSCSPYMKFYMDHLTVPRDVWETLKTRPDISATRSGRTTLLRQFYSARPQGTNELMVQTWIFAYALLI